MAEINRRDYFRLPFAELPGIMQIIEVGQRPITTESRTIDIVDVSGGGMCFNVDLDLPIRRGVIALFTFALKEVQFSFRGVMVRKLDDRKTFQYGVGFVDVDEKQQQQLVSVLGRIQIERRNKAGA